MLLVRFSAIFIFMTSLVAAVPLNAQEATTEAAQLHEAFRKAPLKFELSGGAIGNAELQLVSQPLLNWSNPERRTPAGALYIWTLDGRPEAAMALYPNGEGTIDHEFQSLSLHPLTAVRNQVIVWQPTEAGVEMQRMEDVPEPLESRPGRLRQMRGIAREFSAHIGAPNRPKRPLRLLSSPLYRYPETRSSATIDGAVFGFVQGTDPEVLLILEAVEDSSSGPTWQYGLARISMVPMEVSHRGEAIWETDWARQSLNTPYRVVKEE